LLNIAYVLINRRCSISVFTTYLPTTYYCIHKIAIRWDSNRLFLYFRIILQDAIASSIEVRQTRSFLANI